MKKTKRLIALMLCLLTVFLSLSACVVIDEPKDSGDSSEKESTSAPDNSQADSSASDDSSEGESSETPPVISTESEDEGPLYPESYDERVAYYKDLDVGASVYDVYFNKSVFVGNSIMLHYRNYVSDKRITNASFLGSASFFASASFSMYNNKHQKATDSDCVWPSYRGEQMTIEDAVKAMDVKTVYLSLMALNDIALYSDGVTGAESTYELVKELIEKLKADNPGINVVVLSNTYLYKDSNSMKKLNNGTVSTLNIRVLDYCNQNGIDFIDIATVLLDDDKCLGEVFCSDIGSSGAECHLTKAAYNAWTEILRDYAKKKTEGTWENPKEMEGLSKN